MKGAGLGPWCAGCDGTSPATGPLDTGRSALEASENHLALQRRLRDAGAAVAPERHGVRALARYGARPPPCWPTDGPSHPPPARSPPYGCTSPSGRGRCATPVRKLCSFAGSDVP